MEDCVFCKIVKGEIPAEKVTETENLIVFKDIHPRAPLHFVIATKTHISDIREDIGVNWAAVGKLAVEMAEDRGITGFRLVHNVGNAAAVKHMHVHFLAEISADREI